MKWETYAHEADVGVRGSGATLAEAFAGAATGMTAAICDPAQVAARQAVRIECEAPDYDVLLVDWLNALVYEMATRHMLFARFDVSIENHHLRAVAWGERVDAHATARPPRSRVPRSANWRYCNNPMASGLRNVSSMFEPGQAQTCRYVLESRPWTPRGWNSAAL